MEQKKIKNNPSFIEAERQINGLTTISKIAQFLSYFGIKDDKISETFDKIPQMQEQYKLLANMPDRFNKHFAQVGWIAYESMNFEIMKQAVELADMNKFAEAEKVLVDYYNYENLKWMIMRLNGIEEFRPRMNLIQSAFEDYLAERYYASIPVILMMIDGLVNDIEQTGFFAEGTDLTAWDSIAAHSTGLSELAKIFSQSRKKTTIDEILIPYRNGILHGRDLGYANKIIAAKLWAALFAVRDWAGALKEGKKTPKEEPKEPTFRETLNDIKELLNKQKKLDETKKRISEWKPRNLIVNVDFPETGDLSLYNVGSPERALIEFINYCTKSNYGKMAERITFIFSRGKTIKKIAGELREVFRGKRITGFRIININDEAPAISEIEIELCIEKNNKTITHKCKFRMLYENIKGDACVRGDTNGSWKIVMGYQELEFI